MKGERKEGKKKEIDIKKEGRKVVKVVTRERENLFLREEMRERERGRERENEERKNTEIVNHVPFRKGRK